MQFKVTTGTDVTTNSRVTAVSEGTDIAVPVIGLVSGKWKLWLVSGSSSTWDIINGTVGSSTVSTNTTYWLRLGWDGSTYTLKESTNGSSFTTVISVASSTPIRDSVYLNSVGAVKYVTKTDNQQPWLGSIDMSEFYYKVNGCLVFKTKRQVRLETARQALSNVFNEELLKIRDFGFSKGSSFLYGNYTRFTSPLENKISITNTTYDRSKTVRICSLSRDSSKGIDYIKNYFMPIYFVAEITGWDNTANAECKNTFLYYIDWATIATEQNSMNPIDALAVAWYGSSSYLAITIPSPKNIAATLSMKTGTMGGTAATWCGSRYYGIIGYSIQKNVTKEPSDTIEVKISTDPSINFTKSSSYVYNFTF